MPKFDFSQIFNNFILDDNIFNPYHDLNIDSSFFDPDLFKAKYQKTNCPIFLSINAQSLCSKFEKIKNFILNLTNSNVPIYAIAIQETWSCPVPSDLTLPGFKLYLNERKFSKGGGVGFYVKENQNSKLIKNLTIMQEKIFESLGVEITINRKKILLVSYYRSPNYPANYTQNNAHAEFFECLTNLFSLLNDSNSPCFIFSDSNINLLRLPHDGLADNYFNTLTMNGFLQLILKATRIQGSSFGLIDHIVTNQTMDNVTSGVIISDISDHFFTFNILDWPTKSPTQEFITKRNFSLENLRKFKQALSSVNWNLVTNLENVDTSYDKFWEIFSLHYENSFPLVKMKRNKNFHKINNFMTEGLLISRVTKNP